MNPDMNVNSIVRHPPEVYADKPGLGLLSAKGFIIVMLILLAALWSDSLWARDISQASGNIILDASHGNGEAWGKRNCSSCHIIQKIHKNVPKIKAIVDVKGYSTCTGCHGSNGLKTERQCLICHNAKDLPLKPVRGGKHRHDFNAKKDLLTTSGQCVVCHEASDMNGVFDLNIDLTVFNDAIVGLQPYANKSEFCLRCHNVNHQQKKWPITSQSSRNQILRAEDHFRKTDAHGGVDGDANGFYNGFRTGSYAYKTIVDCSDCHTSHGTQNSNLIIENVLQGAPLLSAEFRNKAYKVTLAGDDYSDLCVLCHQMQTISDGGDLPTRNGLSGVHFSEGRNCITCHSHGEEAQKGL